MKRYLLFCGKAYYPSGGSDDFKSDHECEEDAIQCGIDYLNNNKSNADGCWSHVYDSQEKIKVWEK